MSLARKYPCIFRDPLIREQVNPRLAKRADKVPYAAFQRIWREVHCAELNPYGSESCPYPARDCVLAYYKAAEDALDFGRVPVAYFRKTARSRAYDRADHKPLARERINVHSSVETARLGQGRSVDGRGSSEERSGLRRPVRRPISLGSLFGAADPGPHPRPEHQGEAGSERPAAPREPV